MGRFCPVTGKNCTYLDCQDCGRDSQCEKLFCLVAGSRTFDDYPLLKEKLDWILSRQGGKVVIVHGGARGADTLAERYADENGYDIVRFSADWEKYGKAAGPIRNKEMFEYISNFPRNGAVLFWDGRSPGTKNDIDLAKKYGVRTKVVMIQNNN